METETEKRLLARFKSESGEEVESLLDLPINITVDQLTNLCNNLLEQDELTPYTFFVNDQEIIKSLDSVVELDKFNTENIVEIVYQQQAVFKVQAVTRCTSSMPGHAEAVISVKFSPSGERLASGSGDTTVRFWDVMTQTPHFTSKGHKNWVLCIAWSPDSERLVSACKNGLILAWDPNSGKQLGPAMAGHKQWVTSLVWEPFHSNIECRNFASSSKDCDIRIWDVFLGKCIRTLSGHTKSVTVLQWGGSGLLYSASQDRTIKVWRALDGVLCRTLEGHAHWVNTLALNTEYVIRSGTSIRLDENIDSSNKLALQKLAKKRYSDVCSDYGERLVSGSDDFTLFIWSPEYKNNVLHVQSTHFRL